MDIFERAARCKLRFESPVGDLMVENLYDLHLTHATKPNLDSLAREVFSELKGIEEISFVETKPDPRKIELTLQLDILKSVIESKKNDLAAVENRAKKMELRRQLTEALAAKQGEELKGLTAEQIQAKLAELGGD